MTITDIPHEFINQRVTLSWHEIKFGLEHQLIGPKAAIAKATEQLCSCDSASKEVTDLACLREIDPVAELVVHLAKLEEPIPYELMKEKWLYIVLAWLFENRESLVDALGILESVYSDFDYPKGIASFVRYMPMEGPDFGNREQNEAQMFEHWKTYLNQAAKQYAHKPK